MPPWQAALGDAGVAAVADYVISLSRVERGRVGLGEGQRLFDLYCTACHGADGGGNAALGAPPLNDGFWLYGGDTLEVRTSIAMGRNGVMPPFAARLEPAQIKMLVALLEQQRAAAAE
jgi:cytochrome c oxidase cbb3-type subunit 3